MWLGHSPVCSAQRCICPTGRGSRGGGDVDRPSPALADPQGAPARGGSPGSEPDGFIAKADGGPLDLGEDDLDHTQLRAFCDGVLVGASTVSKDNCRLTVRRCEGDHPVRIVLDPEAILAPEAAVFTDGEAPTIWVRRVGANHPVLPSDVMVLGCRMDENGLDPHLLACSRHRASTGCLSKAAA